MTQINLSKRPYYYKVRELLTPAAYLPFLESSGPTLVDVSGNGRNGVSGGATGPTFGVPGIGDGLTALSFPGSAAYVNWYSTSLRDVFNGAEGTLLVWAKVANAGVWSDGTSRYLVRLSADASNDIRIIRSSSNNNMVLIQHIAGGTSRFTYVGSNAYTGWLMFGITWSVANGEVFVWVNGTKFGASLGAPGTWSGDIASTLSVIGASSTTPGDVFSGSLAHALLLDRPATVSEMQNVYRLIGTPKVITIIGDSIPAPAINFLKWPQIVRDGYNGGSCMVFNHALSGAFVLPNETYSDFDEQAVLAAGDNAEIIIITLGTNDDTGTGVQAEVEENIIELKATNPNATLYYMNVLPRWTDSGGGTPVDKSYVRTPIAAACTAQSVTCWDTYTTPWITAADTSDGLHPNAAGQAKIAAEVLSRLP